MARVKTNIHSLDASKTRDVLKMRAWASAVIVHRAGRAANPGNLDVSKVNVQAKAPVDPIGNSATNRGNPTYSKMKTEAPPDGPANVIGARNTMIAGKATAVPKASIPSAAKISAATSETKMIIAPPIGSGTWIGTKMSNTAAKTTAVRNAGLIAAKINTTAPATKANPAIVRAIRIAVNTRMTVVAANGMTKICAAVMETRINTVLREDASGIGIVKKIIATKAMASPGVAEAAVKTTMAARRANTIKMTRVAPAGAAAMSANIPALVEQDRV